MNEKQITVRKLHPDGHLAFSYGMTLLHESPTRRDIFGIFQVGPHRQGRVVFEPGDHFYEAYFTDRPYNIYAVHKGDSPEMKCWYFNISGPAEFSTDVITWTDYALDLILYPDGCLELLDQDELPGLGLDWPQYCQVWQAVKDLLLALKSEAPLLMPGLPEITLRSC